MGAVAAAIWPGYPQAALLAAIVGAASLSIFRWEPDGPQEERKPFEGIPELGAAFRSLCDELKVTGVLYASFDDEQLLKPVVSTETEPAKNLLIGADPISRTLTSLKPQVFTAFSGPMSLGLPFLQGRSTLVHPLVRMGRPVGLAVLTSRHFEFDEPLIERVRAAEPLLSLLLENEVLAGCLARSQGENETLLALTRLAQGRGNPDEVFREAALHLRRLTGARHVAIVLQGADGHLVLGGLSSEAGVTARASFMAMNLTEREWPNLYAALDDPLGCALLSLSKAPLTPTEAAWAKQIAPNGHLLCAAFGPKEQREGMVLLCWPEDGALRIRESRLTQRLGDLMALLATVRRQGQKRRVAEAHKASTFHLAATQDALIGKLAMEVRNAAFAVHHWREELTTGAVPVGQVLKALDQQAANLSSWLDEREEAKEPAATLRTCVQEAESIAREACRRKGQLLEIEPIPEPELALSRCSVVQILGVLLDNASRFSGVGTSIRVWAAVSGAWTTVYVADHGRGIPVASQARIAEPGFQVEPALGGQGMGLAHVREVVERSGGMLGFTSDEGKGSTFYVTLPIRSREFVSESIV